MHLYKYSKPLSGIMPMNRNVTANQSSEDWTVIFLQSVLKVSKGEEKEFQNQQKRLG